MDMEQFVNIVTEQISEGEKILKRFETLQALRVDLGDGMAHFGGSIRPKYNQLEKDNLTKALTMWERKTHDILKYYWGEDANSPLKEFKVSDARNWLGDFKKMGIGIMEENLTTLHSILDRKDYLLPAIRDAKSTEANSVADSKEKPYKVFISHAKKDIEFVEELVKLLEFLGVDNKDKLFCSSIKGYQIPVSEDFADFIMKQFHDYRLFVIIVHSHNYYASTISMNEMGAAWALKTDFYSILVKGFNYEDMTGVIDSKKISAKVDADDAKARLNELKEKLVPIFKTGNIDDNRWEERRDEFLSKVNAMKITNLQENKDIFDVCYLPIFKEIFKRVNLPHYPEWSYFWAVAGSPRISIENFQNLECLKNFLYRINYYDGYEQYNELLANLEQLLDDYINLCNKHIIEIGNDFYTIERFYKTKPCNPDYQEQLEEYKEYVYLISDMTFELTRLLNLILEKVRERVPDFLVENVVLVIGEEKREYVEYRTEEKTSRPYPGLEQFISIRGTRNYYFSKSTVLNGI